MPTYRRAESLERALDRLCALRSPSGGYEIVVVDDGSPPGDGIPELLAARAADAPVPIRWSTLSQNRGPAAARNEAWRMAAGEWIAFTDDDCQADAGWLVALLDTADSAAADVVQGRTQPDPEREQLLSEPFARSVRVESCNGYFHTCNIMYRRSLLDRLGGLDESFRLIADDTDLGWRAELAGAAVAFAPEAVVTHDVVVGTWIGDVRSRKRWADVVQMIAKHPGSRRLAWKPYIYRRSHVPVLLFMVCVILAAIPPSRGLGLVGVAGLIAADVLTSRRPRQVVAKLQDRVADAYEIALLLRAGVKHRTLLL